MKNNKGITLIALVVTIIVLLILAGITIATLTNDNGVFSNAQKAKIYNAYTSADEQMKLACMDVQTEIATQTAIDSNYDATINENMAILLAKVKNDLNTTADEANASNEFGAEITGTTIVMTYYNTALKANAIGTGKPKTNTNITSKITVSKQQAAYSFDV